MVEVRLCVVVMPQGQRRIVWGRRNGSTADPCLTGKSVQRFVSLGTPHALRAEAVRALKKADSVRGICFVEGNPSHFVAP